MKMRKFWPLLMAGSVGAMGLSSASAESFQLLVGSYTAGASQGIYRMSFDSATGQIEAKPLQVVKSENPSWLTLSKDQKRLFVVNENGPGQTDPVGRVSSYAIDPKTHALSLINQVQSLGNEPTHSSLSHDASHLFVSNYSVMEDPGGTLAVLPVFFFFFFFFLFVGITLIKNGFDVRSSFEEYLGDWDENSNGDENE